MNFNYTMINKLTEFLFYLLFLLTPLVMYKNTSELFEFNKIIFIYLITILIFIAWIFKIIKEKRIIFKRTFLDIPILLFLLTQIISTFFSIDFYTSIFGFYGRFNGGLLSIVTYIFLYYAFVNLFDLNKIEKLLKVSLISTFLVILWGIPGKFGYDLSCLVFLKQLNNNCWVDQFNPSERLFSTLGQPNWLGAYLSINFFISLYFLFKEKAKSLFNRSNLVFVALTVLIFITILFTRSRSSYIGVFFGIGLFSLFKFNFKKISILLITFLISIFIFKTGIDNVDKIISFGNNKGAGVTKEIKTTDEYLVTESFDIRKIVWKGAWKLGLKYPLFGSGVETFAYSYYFTRPQEHNLTSEWDFIYNKAHNEYLNYLATTGFIGLISYLFLIGSVFYILIKTLRNEKDKDDKLIYTVLLASYITILTTNFFGFSTTTINMFFYLIPAFIGTKIIKGQKEFIFKKRPFIIQIFGVSLGLVLLFFLASYYIADLNYAQSEKASQIGDYQSATLYLEKAIKLHNSHVYLNAYSLNLANLAVLLSYQKDSKQSKELMKLALQKSNEAISASPKNVNYLKNKSKIEYLFYYQINPEDRKYVDSAVSTLKKAQELSPTDAKIPYSLSIFYTILYDFTKDIKYKDLSFKEVDKSIKLKSNFTDAYTLKKQLQEKY